MYEIPFDVSDLARRANVPVRRRVHPSGRPGAMMLTAGLAILVPLSAMLQDVASFAGTNPWT